MRDWVLAEITIARGVVRVCARVYEQRGSTLSDYRSVLQSFRRSLCQKKAERIGISMRMPVIKVAGPARPAGGGIVTVGR